MDETINSFTKAVIWFMDSGVSGALRSRYGEPWRHYHNQDHPAKMMRDLHRAEQEGLVVHDGVAAVGFIMYHDAIYDPRVESTRNEILSAWLCESEYGRVAEKISVNRACAAIMATVGHNLPDEDCPDAAILLDLDLAILGAPPEEFDGYNEAIRKEYIHVPILKYNQVRRKILSQFMQREHIYKTEWARAQWEERARLNLEKTIDYLKEY